MTLTFNLRNFFTKNPNLKKNDFFFGGGGLAGGGGGLGGVTGDGGGVEGLTDEEAQTNLPLQLLRSWGHNNALMYKLCP